MGNYFTNPVRQDIEEIGEMIGINMAINAILNRDRAIIKVLAGDCREVMLQGLPYARESCQVPVSQLYGAVIVSPGGYPKDINIYQAQKSFAHAMLVVRPGGWVILAAACPEGSGSQHYEEWVRYKDSNDSVIRSFSEEGFRVGPHKAFLLARDSSQVHLLLVSDIDEALSKSLLIKKVSNLQTAVNMVLSEISENDTIAIMPHASTTIPVLS